MCDKKNGRKKVSSQASQPNFTNRNMAMLKCRMSVNKESRCLRGDARKDCRHIPYINMVKYDSAIFIGWRVARYANRSALGASANFARVIMGYEPILALNSFEL